MSEYLTQQEVEALPEGEPVAITWAGCDDPHVFRLGKLGDWTVAVTPDGHRLRGHVYSVEADTATRSTRVRRVTEEFFAAAVKERGSRA